MTLLNVCECEHMSFIRYLIGFLRVPVKTITRVKKKNKCERNKTIMKKK